MYATLEQANAYVESYYCSSNKLRVAWESLSNSDRTVMLNRAEQLIDVLPFKGRPVKELKAFPRHPHAALSLEKVRTATIELALHLNGDEEYQERLSLRSQGVKSYKLGDLSETFVDVSIDNSTTQFAARIVDPYLREWSCGGFRICPTHFRR